MTILYADHVRCVTATTGTGTLSLGAATTGFRSFAQAVSDGALVSGCTVYYAIQDGVQWECGSGVYTAGSPDTLTRVVAASSAGGTSAISLDGAGVVCVTLTAGNLTSISPPETTLTWSSSTAWVLDANPVAVLTLTGNTTITVSGGISGQSYRLAVLQDSVGGRTVTLAGCTLLGTANWSTAANGVNILTMEVVLGVRYATVA